MPLNNQRNIGTMQVHTREAGECQHYHKCSFFSKYRNEMELYCMSMERLYCKGAKQMQCARLKQMNTSGRFPSDDVSPNGDKIVPRS